MAFQESDQEYARRLQAEENATVVFGRTATERNLQQRLQEEDTPQRREMNSKFTMIVCLIVNCPQILATIIVLLVHWDESVCNNGK